MMEAVNQHNLAGLIERLQAMPASDRRAVLARLNRADRIEVRRMIRSLKAVRGSSLLKQMVFTDLERSTYSAPLKRHLRKVLAGGGKAGSSLTPAASAWLMRHLSPPEGGTAPAAVGEPRPSSTDGQSTVTLAAVSGGFKTASGQY